MIWPLLRFGLRRLAVRTIVAAVLNSLIVAGAMAVYSEPTVEALNEARSQAEPLFRALGLGSSASLTLHVVSLALQLLLPLVGSVYAVSAAALLMAGLVESGEMAHFLASPKSRAAIVRTQAFLLAGGVLVVSGLPLVVALAVGWLMHPGALNMDGTLAAFGGLGSLLLAAAYFSLLVSCMMDTARAARRRAGMWVALFFVAWMVSRADQMTQYLAYVTLYALYQPERLALLRADAWTGVWSLPLIGIACLVYGSIRFTGRDLPL